MCLCLRKGGGLHPLEGGCYGGGCRSRCLSSKAVSFLKLLMEPQRENSGGWVVLPTGCYRKRENLNDISEVERVLGWRVCAWMGERDVVLVTRKTLGGRLDWRLPGKGGNCREHDFEDPLGIRGVLGQWGSKVQVTDGQAEAET